MKSGLTSVQPAGPRTSDRASSSAVRADERSRCVTVRLQLGSGTMRIVVIGGSGHVGSFLVPRLVRTGHAVVNLTRGVRTPYVDHEAWSEVEQIPVDRAAEDAAGTFGKRVAALDADVVVDMICFT